MNSFKEFINWSTALFVVTISIAIVVCSVVMGICINDYIQYVDRDKHNTTDTIETVMSNPEARTEKPTETNEPTIITVECTAYTAAAEENGGRGDGMTASGVIGTPHYTCAADDLPFGTKLEIDGRIWVVQDRFGGGYTGKVDLLMNTKEECYSFGRQFKEAVIIEE